MKVHDLFRAATYSIICRNIGYCDYCKGIYGGCSPCKLNLKEHEVIAFIERVDVLLRQAEKDNTFDWEMTEEEFVRMMTENE